MRLSRPQIDGLRYAKGRQLYAKDVNEGNGNMRRTLRSLIDLGLLAWGPAWHGCLVLTEAGKQALDAVREIDLAAKAQLGLGDKRGRAENQERQRAAKQKLRRLVNEASREAKENLSEPHADR